MTNILPPSGIYDKFKLYVKATGASFLKSDEVPLLEATNLDEPFLRMLLRARGRNRLVGPANGFKTKIKWKVAGGYGARQPGTPVQWDRRGSLEFMGSHYCHEFGSLQLIEDEVKKQVGSVFSAERMAQQFDDVLNNNKQDLYVDLAQTIEKTIKRVPIPAMEIGKANVPRGIFMGMNEWKKGHGTAGEIKGDGAMPGISTIQEYDVSDPDAKMAATVERYNAIGKQDGTNPGHLFEAFARGYRNVKFRQVPLAESYTQGSEGFRECFATFEGAMLVERTLHAHDHVTAEETSNGTLYEVRTRIKGMEIIDVPGLEDVAICPDYLAPVSGAFSQPDPASFDMYEAGAPDQVYRTELESANAKGPRFYMPYQAHIRPIWDEECFMRTSPMYTLDETIPDAMVMHIRNDRNLHFESFRRNLIIAPGANIAGY